MTLLHREYIQHKPIKHKVKVGVKQSNLELLLYLQHSAKRFDRCCPEASEPGSRCTKWFSQSISSTFLSLGFEQSPAPTTQITMASSRLTNYIGLPVGKRYGKACVKKPSENSLASSCARSGQRAALIRALSEVWGHGPSTIAGPSTLSSSSSSNSGPAPSSSIGGSSSCLSST